mmetsp:Transcript_116894/g.162373  ORF Transcript_116894/g.162373 Transcript_116894/m.162373 type:complete len:219 (+) Transcript_116894:2622-3278(+)
MLRFVVKPSWKLSTPFSVLVKSQVSSTRKIVMLFLSVARKCTWMRSVLRVKTHPRPLCGTSSLDVSRIACIWFSLSHLSVLSSDSVHRDSLLSLPLAQSITSWNGLRRLLFLWPAKLSRNSRLTALRKLRVILNTIWVVSIILSPLSPRNTSRNSDVAFMSHLNLIFLSLICTKTCIRPSMKLLTLRVKVLSRVLSVSLKLLLVLKSSRLNSDKKISS